MVCGLTRSISAILNRAKMCNQHYSRFWDFYQFLTQLLLETLATLEVLLFYSRFLVATPLELECASSTSESGVTEVTCTSTRAVANITCSIDDNTPEVCE